MNLILVLTYLNGNSKSGFKFSTIKKFSKKTIQLLLMLLENGNNTKK